MPTTLSIETNPPNTPIFRDNLPSLLQFPNSCNVSPKLPYTQSNLSIKKPWTAPTSPIPTYTYHDDDNNNNSYLDGTLITPQSSPTLLENSSLQLPTLKNIPNNNVITKQNVILPSLRHLQLLPDPRIQEHSYMYPDTSERTPMWRTNLLEWCKNENYKDYMSIKEQNIESRNGRTTNDRFMGTGPLKDLRISKVPSILQSKDPFYGLSDKPWEFKSPLTPPMSPKRSTKPTFDKISNSTTDQKGTLNNNNNNNHDNNIDKNVHDKFNPIISEKLIQCVKRQQRNNSNGINKTIPSINTHKKTNSFKALQIKKMLMDRDVLSINSKRDSKTINNNNNYPKFKNSSDDTVITKIATSLTTTTGIINKNNIDGNSVFIPTKNGTKNTYTLLSSPTLSSNISRSRSPTRRKKSKDNKTPNNNTLRSRSRSRSPIRIVNFSNATTTTPPPAPSLPYQYHHNNNNNNQKTYYSLPRYHTFSLSRSPSPICLPEPTNSIENNCHRNDKSHDGYNTNSYGNNIMLYSNYANKKIFSTSVPRSYSAPTSTNTSPLRGKGTRHSHTTTTIRKCVSCDSQDSPCWRPSWSKNRQDQLCNSCGLRYKKTKTRCLNMKCKKIPTKSELNIMKSQGKTTGIVANNPAIIGPVVGYRCLFCNSITETLD